MALPEKAPDDSVVVPEPSLTDLLAAAGRGDLVAYGTFYDKTCESALRATHRDLVPTLAEQVICAAYVEVWRDSRQLDPADDPLARLLGLIHRNAARELRRIRRDHEELVC